MNKKIIISVFFLLEFNAFAIENLEIKAKTFQANFGQLNNFENNKFNNHHYNNFGRNKHLKEYNK